ncbi:MAG: F0F1 ATP synthase subunit gamma [Ignavibacteria bacterium]|nr:MAG: F0F1 ATP synthase subunit gamma [Ignavibacteria bacterium]KAF0161197.1 MAG: F0F1 ATP synthase subunit gamma [Ignavibacteria bacterium]
MATLRDIKRRIVGVKNTQQITKAMKMVAAARLRRAQENILNARPYSKKISEVLQHLLNVEKGFNNPLFIQRDVKKIALIVVTSDRGLCGSFNMNVIRTAEDLVKGELSSYQVSSNLDIYCLGKKGNDYFTKRNYPVVGSHPGIFSHLKFEFASGFIKELNTKYVSGEIDKVLIVHNEFKSVIQQKTIVEQLFPIKTFESQDSESKQVDYIYEPDRSRIIETLLPKHLNAQMWRVLLDSYAAELGARMTAMDMATENAKELIRGLNLTYNSKRQAAITTEILEIVSGANALKES